MTATETKTFEAKITTLGDSIASLTLKDAVDLADYMKDKYGIEAAAGGGMMMAAPAGDAAPAAEASRKPARTRSTSSRSSARPLVSVWPMRRLSSTAPRRPSRRRSPRKTPRSSRLLSKQPAARSRSSKSRLRLKIIPLARPRAGRVRFSDLRAGRSRPHRRPFCETISD